MNAAWSSFVCCRFRVYDKFETNDFFCSICRSCGYALSGSWRCLDPIEASERKTKRASPPSPSPTGTLPQPLYPSPPPTTTNQQLLRGEFQFHTRKIFGPLLVHKPASLRPHPFPARLPHPKCICLTRISLDMCWCRTPELVHIEPKQMMRHVCLCLKCRACICGLPQNWSSQPHQGDVQGQRCCGRASPCSRRIARTHTPLRPSVFMWIGRMIGRTPYFRCAASLRSVLLFILDRRLSSSSRDKSMR